MGVGMYRDKGARPTNSWCRYTKPIAIMGYRGKSNHPQGLPPLIVLIFRRTCHSFARRKWVLKTVAASGQNEILMNLGQLYSEIFIKQPVLLNNLVWNLPKTHWPRNVRERFWAISFANLLWSLCVWILLSLLIFFCSLLSKFSIWSTSWFKILA